jgi:DNA-binding response OmpR family regulator
MAPDSVGERRSNHANDFVRRRQPMLRLMIQRALSRAGHLVVMAHDGEEAVCVAQERLADLILLDMLLPKLGGRRFCVS